jgi:phosphatidate cytidylyltransferase
MTSMKLCAISQNVNGDLERESKKKTNLQKRLYTSCLALPLIILPILLGYAQIVALFLSIGAFFEWSKIKKASFVLTFSFLSSLIFFCKSPQYSALFVSAVLFLILLWRYKGIFSFGCLYIYGGLYFLVSLLNSQYEILQVLFFVWCGDIFAYFIGKTLKGPKLAPSISPGKTWSGFLGGIIAPVGIFSALFKISYGTLDKKIVLMLVLVSFFAHLGDLLESKAKRHFNIKDSGSILPGHGGFLDRLDSILAVGWVVFVLKAIQKF